MAGFMAGGPFPKTLIGSEEPGAKLKKVLASYGTFFEQLHDMPLRAAATFAVPISGGQAAGASSLPVPQMGFLGRAGVGTKA